MSIESNSGASEFEREYAELKAALRQALTDRGLSLKDLKGASRDDPFFRSLLESAEAILKPKGIYADSLIMTEAVVELEEEADGDEDGGAGVREPLNPMPDSDPYGLLAQARESQEAVVYGDAEGAPRYEMESFGDQERRAQQERQGPLA